MLEERIRGNLRRIREAAGYSRRDLAARCKPRTNYQQIEKLELGERRLTVEWIERLATALDVDVDVVLSASPQFSLAAPVADAVAGAIATVARSGPADRITTEMISLLLQALIETFVRCPEARDDLGAARPVIDLLTRQFSRKAS